MKAGFKKLATTATVSLLVVPIFHFSRANAQCYSARSSTSSGGSHWTLYDSIPKFSNCFSGNDAESTVAQQQLIDQVVGQTHNPEDFITSQTDELWKKNSRFKRLKELGIENIAKLDDNNSLVPLHPACALLKTRVTCDVNFDTKFMLDCTSPLGLGTECSWTQKSPIMITFDIYKFALFTTPSCQHSPPNPISFGGFRAAFVNVPFNEYPKLCPIGDVSLPFEFPSPQTLPPPLPPSAPASPPSGTVK